MACNTLLNCWVWMLVLIGIGERVHLYNQVENSAALVAGATEEDTLRVVGEPMMRWKARSGLPRFIFGKRPAQWIYGTTIDLKAVIIPELPFPNPVPIKIRLFEADDEDLVIDWSDDKELSDVKRPTVSVPESVRKLREPILVFADILRGFRQHIGE